MGNAKERQEMHATKVADERRQLYRTTPGQANQVEVAVWTDTGNGLVGEVVDVSAQGVALRVPRNIAPVLSLGQNVSFPFTPRTQAEPVALRATVRSRNRVGKHWRYGFEFELDNMRGMRFAEEFYGLFNRRDAFRVEPLAEEPIPVTIANLDGSLPPIAIAQLCNVSATGLGIRFSSNADPTLADDAILHTMLRPPTSPCSLKLAGRIRHRTLRGDTVCYGLQFDPKHSEQFERDHENLVDYIIHRQLEGLANPPGPSSTHPPLPVIDTTTVDPTAGQADSAQ